MIHFGLIFLALFLLLIVFMDYQERRNAKKSLTYAAWIVGVTGVILTVSQFMGFGLWSICAFVIIAVLGFSGRFVLKKAKANNK
ncbi:MAG: hypothetical protein NXI10_09755 [bacterium]|nr:hypothetical protein [bacterium]